MSDLSDRLAKLTEDRLEREGVSPEELRSRVERVRGITGRYIDGAPPSVRALVGTAGNEESRLLTLQSLFPDARPFIGQPGNFLYTDPETGRTVIYNPTGLDWGDVASLTREAGQAAGGTLGTIGGAALGTPGGPPGVVGGAVVGAGTGQAIGDEIAIAVGEHLFGAVDARSNMEIAGNFITNQITGMAGETGGLIFSSAVRSGTYALGGAGGTAARAGQEAFRRTGAVPTVGQALRIHAVQGIESLLSKTPGGSGQFARRARETATQLRDFVEGRTSTFAGTRFEPDVAGRRIETGIEAFTGQFRTRGGQLFAEVSDLVPGETVVDLTSTFARLEEFSDIVQGFPKLSGILSNSMIRQFYGAVDEEALRNLTTGTPALTYEAANALRGAIGRKLATFDLVSDVPRAELKALYSALTDDLRGAVANVSDEALAKFDRAARYWRSGIERIDGILEGLAKRALPEDIYRAALSGSAEGATRLRALRRSLSVEEWQVVAGTTLRRLGMANPSAQDAVGGLFSTETFLTNWNRLSDAAKATLFEGPGLPSTLRADLDAVAEVSEVIRQSGAVFRNPSGTAGAGFGQAVLWGGTAGAVGTLVGGDVAYGGMAVATLALTGLAMHAQSRLLTSPAFARWLAGAGEVPVNGLAAHLGRLGAIAAESNNPEFQNAVIEYLDLWGNATGESIEAAGLVSPLNLPPTLDQPPLAAVEAQ